MKRWQLEDAAEQFSRLVECAQTEGPQLVIQNDEEVAVLLDVADYHRLRSGTRDFKQFLLHGPDFDALEIERPSEPARVVEL